MKSSENERLISAKKNSFRALDEKKKSSADFNTFMQLNQHDLIELDTLPKKLVEYKTTFYKKNVALKFKYINLVKQSDIFSMNYGECMAIQTEWQQLRLDFKKTFDEMNKRNKDLDEKLTDLRKNKKTLLDIATEKSSKANLELTKHIFLFWKNKMVLTQKAKERTERFISVLTHPIFNEKEAKAILNAGVEINAVDKQGYTPLVHAIEHGNIPSIIFLLENKADPNKEVNLTDFKKNKVTPLIASIIFNITKDASISKRLLLAGSTKTIHAKDARGLTALQWAIIIVSEQHVKCLLENGARLSLDEQKNLPDLFNKLIPQKNPTEIRKDIKQIMLLLKESFPSISPSQYNPKFGS